MTTGARHEGPDALREGAVLPAGQEALRAPRLRLCPGVVHRLRATYQVNRISRSGLEF